MDDVSMCDGVDEDNEDCNRMAEVVAEVEAAAATTATEGTL
jgi:hypothetical protein